jgi:hypothetical protein
MRISHVTNLENTVMSTAAQRCVRSITMSTASVSLQSPQKGEQTKARRQAGRTTHASLRLFCRINSQNRLLRGQLLCLHLWQQAWVGVIDCQWLCFTSTKAHGPWPEVLRWPPCHFCVRSVQLPSGNDRTVDRQGRATGRNGRGRCHSCFGAMATL